MHHMRITLDGHAFCQLDAADPGDPPTIIAPQIEQLRVFGQFFLVGQQIARQRSIFFRRRTTFARSGDGAHRNALPFQAHQNLGRSTHDLIILEVEIEHVGRRIQTAQRPVQRQRAGMKRFAHALRQHHLHDVTAGDVVLGLTDRGLELRFAKGRFGRSRSSGLLGGYPGGLAQLAQQFPQPCLCLLVGPGKPGLGIDDERELAGQIVDHGNFFRQQKMNIRGIDRVGERSVADRVLQAPLDIADGVVTEAADQPTEKTRQPLGLRRLEACHVVLDERQRIPPLIALGNAIAGQHQHFVGTHHNAGRRGKADDGVATKPLPPLHRFQQIGKRFACQFQIDRQGRIEIGKSFERNRNAVVALGGKRLKFNFSHGKLSGKTMMEIQCNGCAAEAAPKGKRLRTPGAPTRVKLPVAGNHHQS